MDVSIAEFLNPIVDSECGDALDQHCESYLRHMVSRFIRQDVDERIYHPYTVQHVGHICQDSSPSQGEPFPKSEFQDAIETAHDEGGFDHED